MNFGREGPKHTFVLLLLLFLLSIWFIGILFLLLCTRSLTRSIWPLVEFMFVHVCVPSPMDTHYQIDGCARYSHVNCYRTFRKTTQNKRERSQRRNEQTYEKEEKKKTRIRNVTLITSPIFDMHVCECHHKWLMIARQKDRTKNTEFLRNSYRAATAPNVGMRMHSRWPGSASMWQYASSSALPSSSPFHSVSHRHYDVNAWFMRPNAND